MYAAANPANKRYNALLHVVQIFCFGEQLKYSNTPAGADL